MFEDYEPQSTFVRVSCEAVVSSSVFAVRSVSRLVLRAVIRVLIEVARDEAVGTRYPATQRSYVVVYSYSYLK